MIAVHTVLHIVRLLGVALYSITFGFSLYVCWWLMKPRFRHSIPSWTWKIIMWSEINLTVFIGMNLASRTGREFADAPWSWLDPLGLALSISVFFAQRFVARSLARREDASSG